MNYITKIYRSLSNPRLREAWKRFDRSKPYYSEFTSYGYLRNVGRYVSRFMPGYRPRFVTVEDTSGKIVMIAPLKISLNGKKVKMLGDVQGSSKTDFLFDPELTPDQRDMVLETMFSSPLGSKRFNIGRMAADSPAAAWIARRFPESVGEGAECVAIDIPSEGFDSLFATLSKSVRQNVRTAYNRLSRDGVDIRLKVWIPGERVDSRSRREMLRLYVERVYFKYRVGGGSPFKKAIYNLFIKPAKIANVRWFKHDTKSLFSSLRSFHVAIYGGNRMMAFMSGFLSPDGTIAEIPRLAIDQEFSFYSPGYIMICELIKQSGISRIDLLRGTEKYKLDLGGKTYRTFTFKNISNAESRP